MDEGKEYKYGEISIVGNIVEIDTDSILKELKLNKVMFIVQVNRK